MIKSLLFLVAIMPLVAFSQANMKQRSAGELVIHGMLRNMIEPVSYIYIICLDGNNGETDSVRVIDNKYNFRVQTGITTSVTLFAKTPAIADNLKGKYILSFFAEPATVTIVSADSLSNAKVTGSRAYLEFSELEKRREPYSRQWGTLYASYQEREKDDDSVGMAQVQTRIDSVEKKLSVNYYEYIKGHPSALVKPFALVMYMNGFQSNPPDEDVEKAKLVYDKLSNNEKESYFGKKIIKKLDSYKIAIGMMAPGFVQNDTLGNPVSLVSFKGKYVLLDFWASWCIPCREENPNVVKAFNTYKDKGFAVLSISLDRPGAKDKWIEAIHKDGLTWTHVSDLQYWNNAVAKLYKIGAIPQNFLLDPSGKIIGKDLHGVELEKKLKEVLD